MNTQWPLMIGISILVGLASAGLVWTGSDIVLKLRLALAAWLEARKQRAATAGKGEEEDEGAGR